ncbi:cytochrome C biogenesis protein [Haloferax mediterranei ATCC 33500]|uniref:Cytochrome C biogenesis protein n=1 Tax=Haloferax mediterranei (strain ATCC 33500 / DSM 1411 / JCM 8866 / NBRC 14739 / NCIMB 2177 / R-4) TaxID=523841 RepID=I3R403_HALMT|nr:cytochrome c biogenesis protein CcdA [Haloferax mediterranei]AFK18963.1 cytochrome c biogenesis protein [Haloferax mediterranei ATCC 33500]AHZ21675.1 cytochrome C biogenesis protein [Haloferax mediterranei ATCC 33500]EMA03178.1 cytochrome c biogenesis protein [Haloferax mediterranei ATCC 33500]MDX5989055.1 cytochrome c biogenesis protein CcdA [Haloferax mediterranei ATCC 33500]QCQ75447.1 cytochrome C biogenesis protein [Haloferax mediterranei ATCC 33500]
MPGSGFGLGLDPAFAGTLVFAASAGVATFFAPCAFPLLPGYVGYYLSRDEAGLGGAVTRGSVASLAALVVLGALGGALGFIGTRITSQITLLEPVIGAALVVFGLLMFTGRAPSLHVVLPEYRASVAGFGIFGAVYGLAAAGCVIPIFLGVVTQSLALPPAQAAISLGAYAAAAALPLAIVTVLAALSGGLIRSFSGYVGSVQKVAAGVMILAGAWQIWLSLGFLGYV